MSTVGQTIALRTLAEDKAGAQRAVRPRIVRPGPAELHRLFRRRVLPAVVFAALVSVSAILWMRVHRTQNACDVLPIHSGLTGTNGRDVTHFNLAGDAIIPAPVLTNAPEL